MIMRVRWKKFGGHVHTRVFTAPGQGLTFAKCGDLIFTEEEWPEAKRVFEEGSAEVLEDEDYGGRSV